VAEDIGGHYKALGLFQIKDYYYIYDGVIVYLSGICPGSIVE